MRLELQPQAERDIEGIGDYIAKDNPARVRMGTFLSKRQIGLSQDLTDALKVCGLDVFFR